MRSLQSKVISHIKGSDPATETSHRSTTKLDETARKRGKRLLGMMLNTLTSVDSVPAEKETRRREVEERTFSRIAEENGRIAREVEEELDEKRRLAEERREREEKDERERLEGVWRLHKENIGRQRRTTALPSLCWSPAIPQ